MRNLRIVLIVAAVAAVLAVAVGLVVVERWSEPTSVPAPTVYEDGSGVLPDGRVFCVNGGTCEGN